MKQIHEYSVDRAKGVAKIGATNPARKYVDGDNQVTVQVINGATFYFDQGGEPLDVADVPESVLADLLSNPVRRGKETVEQVLKFCDYCPSNVNAIASNDYEAHLIGHMKAFGVPTGGAQAKPETVVEAPRAKRKG